VEPEISSLIRAGSDGPIGERCDGLPFSIQRVALGFRHVRLVVSGELDIATSPSLRNDLRQELVAGHDVELDLSAVEFMDSTGLRAIIEQLEQFADRHRSLELTDDLSPQVKRLFEMVGLLARLKFAVQSEAPAQEA
jgi:anti-anti-sigma factor